MATSINSSGITFPDATTQTTAAGAVTTTSVLAATASASVGAVGSYAFLYHTSDADYAPGTTLAGTSLRYAGVATYSGYWNSYTYAGNANANAALVYTTTTISGTWRCMGVGSNIPINLGCSSGSSRTASLWLRVS